MNVSRNDLGVWFQSPCTYIVDNDDVNFIVAAGLPSSMTFAFLRHGSHVPGEDLTTSRCPAAYRGALPRLTYLVLSTKWHEGGQRI